MNLFNRFPVVRLAAKSQEDTLLENPEVAELTVHYQVPLFKKVDDLSKELSRQIEATKDALDPEKHKENIKQLNINCLKLKPVQEQLFWFDRKLSVQHVQMPLVLI